MAYSLQNNTTRELDIGLGNTTLAASATIAPTYITPKMRQLQAAGFVTITGEDADVQTAPVEVQAPVAVAGTARTLQASDAGKRIEATNASAQVITVPPNSSVPFPLGTEIDLVRLGAGTVTVAAGAGVTIRSRGGLLSLNGQYAVGNLYKRATDEWVFSGDRV